ncbi:MAG: L-carnitine dehydratase/bile acid-inducible protein [Frankiales bacterium]|nr:L-carnitine dehydratase/bile acid-inducible protein [Frankiales bacterium]
MSGPLQGIRVVELAGLGPAPYACMLLSDLGAEVLRVDRPAPGFGVPAYDVTGRGRRSLALDLKQPAAAEVVLRLVDRADVLVEGLRPGVAERLGVGPDACLARNPRLVYGRMTGWGQDGPLAPRVGHDINYASITGALGAIGEPGRKPVPPLNLVADFGGGSMFLVTGVLAALLERATSGQGQVVDAAMVDGVTSLMAMTYGFRAAGGWADERGSNLLDGGAPFYDTYPCSDGQYVAIGALEPQFWALVVQTLGLEDLPEQYDRDGWPVLRQRLAEAFATRTRDEWAQLFDGLDACVSPVLTLGEAPQHAHLAARQAVVEVDGVQQPAPAPRFSRTPGAIGASPRVAGTDTREALQAWGFHEDEVAQLEQDAVVAQA